MRQQSTLLRVLGLAVVVGLSGCTVAKISGRGVAPILLNNPQVKVELIKPIRASRQIVFDYTAAFDASEILSGVFAETDADAIINVSFAVKTTLSDFFINLFTLGIAAAKTMQITGDAVKAPAGLGLLDRPGVQILGQSPRLDDLMCILIPASTDQDPSITAIIRTVGHEGSWTYTLARYPLADISKDGTGA